MILTTHALTGAVIGKNITDSWLIIILSLFLHFVMDRFRHGEYLNRKSSWKDSWKTMLDLSVSGIIIFSIIKLQNITASIQFNIFLGIFFSLLPDAFTLLYWKMKVNFLKPIYNFHSRMHRYPPLSSEREWTLRNAKNDIIWTLIAIAFLLV